MTAYNPRNDSPTGIITLEQSILHQGMLAQTLHGNDTYNELGGGLLERFAQVSIIQSANQDIRAIVRCAVILSPEYVTGAQKLWMYAQPWASATVPPTFKVD
ncbi:hypothetical protein PGN35_025335 [Nodosilinea sp. PGN35]|uniref:hypothetical protein n=1 Tax=Nodosilinea sp. PGN35 TaxID=3020489 RepID=UPI0023B2482D|nr:hypothetical protein [Nodosilinea sp. TSF1-S3]MDF0367441.1 hypothetical protein [Nodosilinea sp. TSF1-S3]